jgi:hypothetical protein
MPTDQTPPPESVAGSLMDYSLVGSFLAKDPKSVRTWMSRKESGHGGIPGLFPVPTGQLCGGPVWQVEDIVAFRDAYVARAGAEPGDRTPEFIDGPLMDYRLIGAAMRIGPDTVRLWWSRKKNGEGGIPSFFPEPVGQLCGGPVWKAADIVIFREAYLTHDPRGGRRRDA